MHSNDYSTMYTPNTKVEVKAKEPFELPQSIQIIN